METAGLTSPLLHPSCENRLEMRTRFFAGNHCHLDIFKAGVFEKLVEPSFTARSLLKFANGRAAIDFSIVAGSRHARNEMSIQASARR